MTLPFIVLLPLLGALLPGLLTSRHNRIASAWIAALVTGLALALLLLLAPRVFAGETVFASWTWIPTLGINLDFRLDGLGLLFGILILGIGLLVILYARYYLSDTDPMRRFYSFLLLFMSAMLGIVLSENIILLLLFWELTSLTSFLLIGYWKHLPEARQGARMALAVTGGGGLALLAGFLLLGHITGSYQLSVILAAGDIITNHSLYPWIATLILLGAFTKSAQFPFHFWLPHAMTAPTPVSAYLHSATMVKAGIFLLARFFPALSGTDLWFYLVGGTGLITLLFGAYIALFKHDLKGLLAYSTISHLGLITLLFGLGTPLGELAGVFHIINHAIFKASLFMAAGIIDHETGTRDMRRLNGLFKYMPRTAILAMVAAGSMAGVPLLNGFLSKEMFFAETLHVIWLGSWYWILPVLATLAGIFSVAYSARFIHDVFFNGEPINLPRSPHEPPVYMRVPVEILVVLCLVVGVFPSLTVGDLLFVTVDSVLLDEPLPDYSLSLWHGFNLPLLMSFIALTGGILVYTQRYRLFHFHEHQPLHFHAKGMFDTSRDKLIMITQWVTATLENGSLQRYLVLLIGSVLVVGIGPLWQTAGSDIWRIPSAVDEISLTAAVVLAVAATITVRWHRQRLTALIALSVVGLMVSLFFVRFSAPDLALTQLSVEMVTIVLFLLALYYLPQQTPIESSSFRRGRDATLALLMGAGTAILTWTILTRPYQTIADYFLANSVPGGGGTNVVNVILVDFRGFDTLGEITVLAITAIGIYALLWDLSLTSPGVDPQGRSWAADRHPTIMANIAHSQLSLALLVAIYIFLRGHNLPGGGFIAGLIAALTFVLQYLASGIQWTEARLRLDYNRIIALGLLCAVVTGLGSWLFQRPFLTSTFAHIHWPIIGDFELASAMIFDLGIFLTVVGAVLLILSNLGALSQRSPTSQPSTERETI